MERYETDGDLPSWNPFTPSEADPIGVRSIGTTEVREVKVLPQHHPEEVKIFLASIGSYRPPKAGYSQIADLNPTAA